MLNYVLESHLLYNYRSSGILFIDPSYLGDFSDRKASNKTITGIISVISQNKTFSVGTPLNQLSKELEACVKMSIKVRKTKKNCEIKAGKPTLNRFRAVSDA